MTDLSPAAQAVMHSLWGADLDNCQSIEDIRRRQAAAVLRAAAQQVEDLYCADLVIDDSDGAVFVLRQLMLIAAELEGAQ